MRVLLANTQPKVRSALRLLLTQNSAFVVVGEAADATGLLLAVAQKKPALILLDWELPGLPPAYLLRLLRGERAAMRILALSSRPEVRATALAAGADGFINKTDPPEKVFAEIEKVAIIISDDGTEGVK